MIVPCGDHQTAAITQFPHRKLVIHKRKHHEIYPIKTQSRYENESEHNSTKAGLEEFVRQCHDQEARELEAERRTRALDLNAVRDARVRGAALRQEAAIPVVPEYGSGCFLPQGSSSNSSISNSI